MRTRIYISHQRAHRLSCHTSLCRKGKLLAVMEDGRWWWMGWAEGLGYYLDSGIISADVLSLSGGESKDR